MAGNIIALVFTLLIVLVNVPLRCSTRTIQQSPSSLKSPQPTLDWSLWASKSQNFTNTFGQILLPTQDPLDLDDTDSVRKYSVKLIKGTANFTDELSDFLMSHRNVTNVWDVYLLRNLLDFYAGIFIYKYSRLTELYTDMTRAVQSFKGSGREVHKYFFLVNGYRSFLKRFEASTKKFITEMMTASPPHLALSCTYERGIYLRLDRLMDSLAVPDPAMTMVSTEYFNIRAAKRSDSCIALPELFQQARSESSIGRINYYDHPQGKLYVRGNTTRVGSFDGFPRRDRPVKDAGHAIPLELSSDCLTFRFVSVGEEGRAGYTLLALAGDAPYALHFSESPPGSVVLRPLQRDEVRGSASDGLAGLLPTSLLPIRMAGGEVLLVHRGVTGSRQFLAMEHVTDGKISRVPIRDAGPRRGSSDAATGDQTIVANSKFVEKGDDGGGFHESNDAVHGRGHSRGSKSNTRQEREGVSFDSDFENQEDELQLNDFNENIETVHDEDGKNYTAEVYLGTKQNLVYVIDYQGEGTHWLLEKVV